MTTREVLSGKVRAGMRVRLYDRHTGRWVVVVAASDARPASMPFWTVFDGTDGRIYGANVSDTFTVESDPRSDRA
jgi:hypothetical protein